VHEYLIFSEEYDILIKVLVKEVTEMGEQQVNMPIGQDVASYLGVRSPEDVRALGKEDIPVLCRKLRRVLIEQTQRTGGHLASNLGVVEMTVAIHRVFHAPVDQIVFDVGHQSYVHKLLTGRADAFATLRTPGGLSGFPRRDESEYDAFGTGHASTSLSAALGLARAAKMSGSGAYTVVVLGDGALTGGMIHEALNNCEDDLKLIIILNENEMSISKNEGHYAQLLTRLRTSRPYYNTKSALSKTLSHVPVVGKPLKEGLVQIKRGVKRVLYSNNYFESMGLNYFGPVDGHDEPLIEHLLRAAKGKKGSSIIHVKTTKGRGYAPAEQNPSLYHGIAPMGMETTGNTFSHTFGKTLTDLAGQNERICAITAAMREGTGLVPFANTYPDRFFDVGIAEEHAVTFAAGLSVGGYTPVVAIYSTFLQRSYDQILHDVALQRLPVLFAIDRAGLNAADGLTHHGIYDVAFLSDIPAMEIWHPLTTASLSSRLTSLLTDGLATSTAIRYHSGGDDADLVALAARMTPLSDGLFADFDVTHPPKTVVVTYGRETVHALRAIEACGGDTGLVVAEKLRPASALTDALAAMAEKGVSKLVLCEEGICSGGFAMTLATDLATRLLATQMPTLRIVAIDSDRTLANPKPGQSVFDAAGIGEKDILRAIQE
jgi:1-deoxy-D-xylulose-5-phosphate synthase